ncbi:F-box protein CPR1-like [Rhododendron vialii]|uniref:F-box protein CPR1-like n=1 Tax=Rhododendron vialii TaxID=182163 RepID=UPI00265E942E|nr:F-box protein CPR1-like [Rhododendron vialii]
MRSTQFVPVFAMTPHEYKAVLALAHQTPEYGGEFVAVGSLRSKSWTQIGFPYMVRTVNSGPIVNGSLHWFASKNNSGSYFLSPHQIIYFNAHMNKFEEVTMPDPRGEDRDIIHRLGVLDGYLCMSQSVCLGDSESNVEVLIMKEYGVKYSWTILFVVPDGLTFSSYDTLVPLGYTKNGEVLTKVNLFVVHGWHIRAFNLTDNSQRRISIRDSLYVNDSFYAIIVNEESLMTPANYDWDEE